MQVRINFDVLTAPAIEDQLKDQGATLGRMADQIQNALTYCNCLYVWGYLPQSEAIKINEKIYKDVQASVRSLEEVKE